MDGREAALKIGIVHSSSGDIESEIAALTCYSGCGTVPLIEYHAADGALLLERAFPGTPLAHEHDEESTTHIAARTMQTIWRAEPLPSLFESVGTWGMQRLSLKQDALPPAIDPALAASARAILQALLNAPNEPVLLHGDLHHWNLLRVDNQVYWAIDPKGRYGDPLYEVIAWLRNWPTGLDQISDPFDAMRKRVQWLSNELSYPIEQVAAWGFSGLLFDAWHDSLQDPEDSYPTHVLRCATLLAPLAK